MRRIFAAPKLSLIDLIDQIRSRKECIAQGRRCFERAIEWVAHLLIEMPIIIELPIIEELSKAWDFAVARGEIVVSSCWESPFILASAGVTGPPMISQFGKVMFVRPHPPESSQGDNQI